MTMKIFGKCLGTGVIACALLLSGAQVLADDAGLRSLRGDVDINKTNIAADLKQWQNGKGKVARSFAQQPPVIPHPIEGYAINNKVNTCMNCHDGKAAATGATKVGVSHFKNRDGKKLSKVAPRRYFCTQCHVPQKEADALVKNTFMSTDTQMK